MKRLFAVFLVIGLVFSFVLPAGADGPVGKLTRGAMNVVSSPLEVPNAIWAEWQLGHLNGFLSGLTWGSLVGIFKFTKRAVVGVYEIATFPVPIPADYKPIIEDPAFFQ